MTSTSTQVYNLPRCYMNFAHLFPHRSRDIRVIYCQTQHFYWSRLGSTLMDLLNMSLNTDLITEQCRHNGSVDANMLGQKNDVRGHDLVTMKHEKCEN